VTDAGLSLDELVERTGLERRDLHDALTSEITAGRVTFEDGRYRLRPGSLSPQVVRALRAMQPPDVTAVALRRRQRPVAGRLVEAETVNLLV
jgi:hypothetical protein